MVSINYLPIGKFLQIGKIGQQGKQTMERSVEVGLIEELLNLKAARSAFLDDETATQKVDHYWRQDRFEAEQAAIFRKLPHIVAHVTELAAPGSFLRRKMAGLPLLLTRDDDGQVHAFLNVCRHRGTRLVDAHEGCQKRFSCPYHAWTWNNRGDLIGVPHEKQGFPGLDRATMGLKRLPAAEFGGFIWVSPQADTTLDIEDYLAGLAPDFDWFGGPDLRIVGDSDYSLKANWKILIEGGIEAYHFKIAHRHTIGPYFNDNLSSYQAFGTHMRAVLPRASIVALKDTPQDDWQIRDHANVLYSFLPTNQFLVQQDHVVWIRSEPVAADLTELRIATLAKTPPAEDMSEREAAHWAKNHAITTRTLDEDFEIGESIQSGLQTGANDVLTFGKFEGALTHFSALVDGYLEGRGAA